MHKKIIKPLIYFTFSFVLVVLIFFFNSNFLNTGVLQNSFYILVSRYFYLVPFLAIYFYSSRSFSIRLDNSLFSTIIIVFVYLLLKGFIKYDSSVFYYRYTGLLGSLLSYLKIYKTQLIDFLYISSILYSFNRLFNYTKLIILAGLILGLFFLINFTPIFYIKVAIVVILYVVGSIK